MVTFPMTLTDPNPVFKVTKFSEVEYLKGQSYFRTLIGNRHNLSNGTTFNDLQ